MSKDTEKGSLGIFIFYLFALIFFACFFAIGTFNDEAIAKTLFSPDNMIAKIITSVGVYPFFVFGVIFIGALYERVIHSSVNKALKGVICVICILAAAFICFIGTGALIDKDCFGNIFPVLVRNIPVIAGISIVTIFPIFYLGYHLAAKCDDKLLIKRVICLIVIMILAYVCLELFKNIFARPRYRTVVLGYDGIGYLPWYTKFMNAADYVNGLGIDKGEFRSFPSGHAILSTSLVYILQSFCWFGTKLKNKRFLLGLTGFVFSVIIMFTRMVLGAHYLSDVSAGAMIGTVLAIIYTVIQQRIDKAKEINGR